MSLWALIHNKSLGGAFFVRFCLLYVYEYPYEFMCTTCMQVSLEATRGHWTSWCWSELSDAGDWIQALWRVVNILKHWIISPSHLGNLLKNDGSDLVCRVGHWFCVCRMCFLQHFDGFTYCNGSTELQDMEIQRHICKIIYLHFKFTLKIFLG